GRAGRGVASAGRPGGAPTPGAGSASSGAGGSGAAGGVGHAGPPGGASRRRPHHAARSGNAVPPVINDPPRADPPPPSGVVWLGVLQAGAVGHAPEDVGRRRGRAGAEVGGPLVGSSTRTTRIVPPAGCHVATNVLYRLTAFLASSSNAPLAHPRRCPVCS